MPEYAVEFTDEGLARVSGIFLKPREYTIEAYIKTADLGHTPIAIWGQFVDDLIIFYFGLTVTDTGVARFGVWDAYSGVGYNIDGTTPINDNVPHHIAGVVDRRRRKLRLFVDGVKENEVDGIFYPPADIGDMRLGRPAVGKTVTIDDVRFSSVARYYNNFTPPYKRWPIDGATLGYWYMDEGAGNILHDASPNHFDMTMTPDYSWVEGFVEKEVIIMPIVSHVQLVIPQEYPPAEWVGAKWQEGLTKEAERINQKRKARIPDRATFETRLAGTSSAGFAPMIKPDFHTRGGLEGSEVIIGQDANLRRSFDKYQDALDYVFETVEGVPAKRFKERVARRKQAFLKGLAERGMPFTGIRTEILGAAAIASLWLVGDRRVIGFLRGADKVLEGGPWLIAHWRKVAQLKAALTGRLTQSGVLIVKSGYNPALMTTHNQIANEEVQGFTDPALNLVPFTAGGDSHVDYIMIAGQLWLDIQVSKM